MPVNPGRLRHRVELFMGVTTNTVGGPTTEWDHFDTVWAHVTQIRASGAAKYAMAATSDVTHEIIMRADIPLSLGGTLFKWRSRTLQPAAPPRARDDRFQVIACKEVPPDGEDSS